MRELPCESLRDLPSESAPVACNFLRRCPTATTLAQCVLHQVPHHRQGVLDRCGVLLCCPRHHGVLVLPQEMESQHQLVSVLPRHARCVVVGMPQAHCTMCVCVWAFVVTLVTCPLRQLCIVAHPRHHGLTFLCVRVLLYLPVRPPVDGAGLATFALLITCVAPCAFHRPLLPRFE